VVLLLDESYGESSTSGDRGADCFAWEGGVSVESHDMLGKDEARVTDDEVRAALADAGD
jgi:hypothetical protein